MDPITIGLLAGAALGGAKGIAQGARNKKIQAENEKFRKAAIMYSPWTNMQDPGAGPMGPGSAEAGIGGALSGAATGAMVGGIGAGAAPAAAAPGALGALGGDMSSASQAIPGVTTSDLPAGKQNLWQQMLEQQNAGLTGAPMAKSPYMG